MNRNLLVISILILSVFVGCADSGSTTETDIHLGGHFVNPLAKFITLQKDSITVDTAFLDTKGNFNFYLEEVPTGFYMLHHSYESQLLYFEPGDSILMWGNTLDFDNSLYFSGRGAGKNNLLVNLFLQTRKNTDLILDYYKIPPAEFETLTDSVKTKRLQLVNRASEKNQLSDEFKAAAEKMVQFEHNNLREQYTYLINKYYPEYNDDFPSDFYTYRKEISFNEREFQSTPAYHRMLENYLINLSLMDCRDFPEKNNCYDTNNYENISERIELTDSLSQLPVIRNHLFNKLGSTGMVMGKDRVELRSILEELQEKGLPQQDFRNLLTLGSIQLAFIPGINLGNTPLLQVDQKPLRASSVIKRRSIFYIWSILSPTHHKKQHKTINEMRAKYPDIDFIGINIDIARTSAWENALRKYGYDLENEYQLDKIQIQGRDVGPDVFKSYLNKLLFVDANGTVLIGDALIHSPDFESRILEFLNL